MGMPCVVRQHLDLQPMPNKSLQFRSSRYIHDNPFQHVVAFASRCSTGSEICLALAPAACEPLNKSS